MEGAGRSNAEGTACQVEGTAHAKPRRESAWGEEPCHRSIASRGTREQNQVCRAPRRLRHLRTIALVLSENCREESADQKTVGQPPTGARCAGGTSAGALGAAARTSKPKPAGAHQDVPASVEAQEPSHERFPGGRQRHGPSQGAHGMEARKHSPALHSRGSHRAGPASGWPTCPRQAAFEKHLPQKFKTRRQSCWPRDSSMLGLNVCVVRPRACHRLTGCPPCEAGASAEVTHVREPQPRGPHPRGTCVGLGTALPLADLISHKQERCSHGLPRHSWFQTGSRASGVRARGLQEAGRPQASTSSSQNLWLFPYMSKGTCIWD